MLCFNIPVLMANRAHGATLLLSSSRNNLQPSGLASSMMSRLRSSAKHTLLLLCKVCGPHHMHLSVCLPVCLCEYVIDYQWWHVIVPAFYHAFWFCGEVFHCVAASACACISHVVCGKSRHEWSIPADSIDRPLQSYNIVQSV